MTWLHPNRTTPQALEQSPALQKRPYIDTPKFSYVEWLQASVSEGVVRIGQIENSAQYKVAVIGAGAAGLAACYELLALGLDVSLFEQSDKIGGRMDSVPFVPDSPDLAELGAMRFPPSEETLFYYLDKFGIDTVADFPDPGKVPTAVSYQGNVQFIQPYGTPAGFETVSAGWQALMKEGALVDGVQLAAPNQIEIWLRNGQTTQAIQAWQEWLDVMDNRSLFNGLVTIFCGDNPPGGKAWSYPEDLQKFSALGAGFGGFGPLYQVGFLEIIRLVVNGLETDQRSVPGGIRSLAEQFASAPVTRPDGSTTTIQQHLSLDTECSDIQAANGKVQLCVNGQLQQFDRVIVATTNRAMELDIQAARFDQHAVLNANSATAVRELHMMNSSKTFVRVAKRFWNTSTHGTRVILNDTLSRNVYTLEYGGDSSDTGVVLASYVWGDASTKDITFTDKKARLDMLRNDIAQSDPEFASHLYPKDQDYDNNVQIVDWETQPHYYGAFKLNRPGQSHFTQSAYYQFLDAGTCADKQVYIAGSAISWTGGWIEGGLQTGLNAAAAVVKSLGGSFTSEHYNPFTRLQPDVYKYR